MPRNKQKWVAIISGSYLNNVGKKVKEMEKNFIVAGKTTLLISKILHALTIFELTGLEGELNLQLTK